MLSEGPADSDLTTLIESWNDTGALKNDAIEYLERVDAGLKAAFTPLIQINPLLHGRSQAIDTVMGKLWQAFMPDAPGAALLAVGGYGRGELYPASDIDLLILLEAQPSEDFCSAISELITLAWDIGLQVGHSVRTLKECESLARDDLTIITTMMEARTIAGNANLAPQLAALIAPENMWPSDQFFAAKLDEQRARHTKYANSEYRLEPNVKTSPGGLRDIQLIGWVAHRHYGSAIEHLRDEAFLNDAEQEMLDNGRNFIGQVRFALHVLSGRDENRLLFDFQRKLAAEWGFEDGDKLAVEQFMQVYYRWAQSLSQLNDHLMQIFERSILATEESAQRTTLDDDFEVCGGHLTALNDKVFERSPGNLLRAFVLLATHEDIIRLDAETQRLLRDSTILSMIASAKTRK
ncbi:protein-P-II uridylyltransferase [Luminiphilus syltensis NOR5-1B]|uniref:Bifunctional uridylyltransferase/uridylyl-removing enzyme n=1 Tax=Luminiphilus syltensis NOR5-1B TaxID=565045 RepID=B8KYA2_9GAMM|nr:nucleotidyltransferase domain-containing protein [Luminiphilus syltensis]EED34990.1 protein-P-II uridylyltransferase [Luminiphilus syltensis NOR5-1B]